MKNETLKKQFAKDYSATLGSNDYEANLPLAENDVIEFIESENLVDVENKIGGNVVPMFNLSDGRKISVSAICTKGNGLKLTGKRSEMFAQFLDMINEKLSIRITKRFTVPTSNNTKVCYIFEKA